MPPAVSNERLPGLATRLVHPPAVGPARASAPALVRATTFRLSPAAEAALAAGDPATLHDVYGRWGSPTVRVAAATVAALYGTEAACVCASGLAAIRAASCHFLGEGATLYAAHVLYGGTEAALREWVRERGLVVRRFDPADPQDLGQRLVESADAGPRLVFVETLSNPLVVPADLAGIAAQARRHGVPVVVDDTFGAGIVAPGAAGWADLIVGSATKFLGGHGDVVAGYVAGASETVAAVHRRVAGWGAPLDPTAAYLLVRGAKTLPLRFARAQATAAALVRRAAAHPNVAAGYYPGIGGPSLPEGFDGGGAVFSLDLGTAAAARRCVDALQLWMHATSLGGVESLVSIPARSSHAALSPDERRARGITEGLVRFSPGIEDADDLWADLCRGLDAAAGGAA